jgi:hypothetical protein
MGTLRDLKSYGEPGAVVYLADCVELMRMMPPSCVDAIFADPLYRLSGGGVTVKSGRLAPLNKGGWDCSMGIKSTIPSYERRARKRPRRGRPVKPDPTMRCVGSWKGSSLGWEDGSMTITISLLRSGADSPATTRI